MLGKNSLRALVVMLALGVLAVGSAPAGFISGSVRADLPNPPAPGGGPPPWAGPPDFVFDLTPGNAGHGRMRITERFGGPGTLPMVISGETDADPIMTVTKEVENNSGIDWYGYVITLPAGGDMTFVGTATSDRMDLVAQGDYYLWFIEPDVVLDGETVEFAFDVLVPTTGFFSFTLTQEPLALGQPPEPATLTLLILGGLGVLVSRRRR